MASPPPSGIPAEANEPPRFLNFPRITGAPQTSEPTMLTVPPPYSQLPEVIVPPPYAELPEFAVTPSEPHPAMFVLPPPYSQLTEIALPPPYTELPGASVTPSESQPRVINNQPPPYLKTQRTIRTVISSFYLPPPEANRNMVNTSQHNRTDGSPQYDDYMRYSILNLLFCCTVFAIGAIIYSYKTRDALKRGDTFLAQWASARARAQNLKALACGIFVHFAWIIYVIYYCVTHRYAYYYNDNHYFNG
ncbi:proline rich transmembrane protein 1B-like [Pelobates fuscus]|uniref:proline rich transmembrane protein 1B-like n=1 Tax=Pelobates fuscus TaxID=191477 RepID=UPI002FE4CFAB